MLAPGARIGPFEVLSPLGAGGMGEVYRARDPRLGREVAIKVLPLDRLADEGRRRRFLQEARSASALNHPHIVTVHEIGSSDGVDFIVMEYVAGQTLNLLIPKEGMPLRDALHVATAVADAVTAAHARGIVHRDLKPANVVVSSEGVVKVLDFGLAKLVAADRTDGGATQTTASVSGALSRPGAITGTAAYMSPEQATGGQADARSDIFSFGALVYEMVTGRRAFPGKTVSETLTAVVRDQPRAPRELVPAVPEMLDKLILRCLRKEAGRRFQHMADVRVELEEIREELDSAGAGATTMARRHRAAWALAGVALVGLAAVLAYALRQTRGAPSSAPRVEPLTALPGDEAAPTFSPDGRQVAFSWNGERQDNYDIYVKLIGTSEVHRLTTDAALDSFPAWSPDGRRIAFVRTPAGGTPAIHVVSPLGGPDRKLIDWPARGGLSWSPDGKWLATGRAVPTGKSSPEERGIYVLSVEGGEPHAVTRALASGLDRAPALSPDGRRLAYAACESRVAFPPCDVHVVDLYAGFRPAAAPRRLTREGLPILRIAWLPDGRSLVYDTQAGSVLYHLWRVDADGTRPPERLELAGEGARGPAISGTRLALRRDFYDVDLVRFAPGRRHEVVLASSYPDGASQFSPDGRRIALESVRSGQRSEVWLATADGRDPVQLTDGPGRMQGSPTWSPDGQRVAFDSLGEGGHWDIWTVDVAGGTPRRLTEHPGSENVPTWSRDGRFVYYGAEREGRRGIWRIPAGGGIEERVVDLGTGGGPGRVRESFDGRTLFYLAGPLGRLLLAHSFAGGADRKLVECVAGPWGYDVAERSLYYASCEGGPERQLHRLDLATGGDRILGPLEKYDEHVTVSPDGKTVLYTTVSKSGSDLMLVENFR